MRRGTFGTLGEMALVFAAATVLGVAWNHSLLLSAWRGEATSPPAAGEPAVAQGAADAVPLPLGLMQIKEMYDAKAAAIVDARDAETYAAGHIEGALSLPMGEAVKGVPADFKARVPVSRDLIVYCSGFSCHDSIEVGKLLIKAGYRSVYVYEGGFPEWQDAGYPVGQGRKP